ncbi:MAG: TonB-dependent receptor [Bacteroidota bacterium]
MMKAKPLLSLLGIFLLCLPQLSGQTFTVSGYIKDVSTGETLVQANLFNQADVSQGTVSNIYGFYSLSLPAGQYTLVCSYLGYGNLEFDINLDADISHDIELIPGVTMQEVLVKAEDEEEQIQSTSMGTIDLPVENIRYLPAFMGEVDILKTLQLLPGVLSAGEGNAGFFVRGGGPDQNLILLDEAVVYNSGHMLGFFSVFNSDAIKNTTLIKGNIPANFGGRVSSVVDVQMKDGNNKRYQFSGGVGAISTRLTVEGPIISDKSSFMLSGRRTYAFDLAQPFLNSTDFAGTNYYFYDLNAKLNHRFSKKDRLYLSTYFGRDILRYRSKARGFQIDMPYGNATATLRWNHLFSDKLFMNLTAVYNNYDFQFAGAQSDFTVDVFSGVRDYNAKLDFDFFPNPKHQIKFGLNYTYHRLTPNVAEATSGEVQFNSEIEAKYASELALYWLDDFKWNNKLTLQMGVRASMFNHLGPYDDVDKQVSYEKGEWVNSYFRVAPRLSLKYTLDEQSALKGGVSFNYQYIHLVSNSTSTLPIDVWVPSSPLVKPQLGIQYALGYFRNFLGDEYEASIETYYKDLSNQIDYRENYVNNVNVELEQEFVFGTGRAYGLELFLKKRRGRFNGWIGYSLARTDRTFPDIRNGETFPARFDRTHDLSIVGNYELNEKWRLAFVFVYGTGNTYTPIKSLFLIDQRLRPEYGPRNSARIQPYHRLDLSATFTPKPNSGKKFQSNWVFSIYNVYNRQNTYFLYPDLDVNLDVGFVNARLFRVSLFPIIPSVTWNFKFGR